MTDFIARRSWDHTTGAPVVRIDPMAELEAAIENLREIDPDEVRCRPRRAPCSTCGFTVASRPCSTACTATTL